MVECRETCVTSNIWRAAIFCVQKCVKKISPIASHTYCVQHFGLTSPLSRYDSLLWVWLLISASCDPFKVNSKENSCEFGGLKKTCENNHNKLKYKVWCSFNTKLLRENILNLLLPSSSMNAVWTAGKNEFVNIPWDKKKDGKKSSRRPKLEESSRTLGFSPNFLAWKCFEMQQANVPSF